MYVNKFKEIYIYTCIYKNIHIYIYHIIYKYLHVYIYTHAYKWINEYDSMLQKLPKILWEEIPNKKTPADLACGSGQRVGISYRQGHAQ